MVDAVVIEADARKPEEQICQIADFTPPESQRNSTEDSSDSGSATENVEVAEQVEIEMLEEDVESERAEVEELIVDENQAPPVAAEEEIVDGGKTLDESPVTPSSISDIISLHGGPLSPSILATVSPSLTVGGAVASDKMLLANIYAVMLPLCWCAALPPPKPPNYHLQPLKESVGQSILAAANESGYEAEILGLVVIKKTICSTVDYNLSDWLSGRNFAKVVDELRRDYKPSKYLRLSTMKIAFRAIHQEHKIDMLQAFDDATRFLPKLNVNNAVSTEKIHHVKSSSKLLGKKSEPKEEGDLESEFDADYKAVLRGQVDRFENDLKTLSFALVQTFKDILAKLKDGKLSASIYEDVGGDDQFRELSKKILGAGYRGSVQEYFGDRVATLQSVSVLGVKGEMLVTEVCMLAPKMEEGKLLVKMIPRGKLTNDIYSTPILPRNYVGVNNFTSLNNLMIASELLFFQEEFAVVDNFQEQIFNCRLENKEKCTMYDVNISNYGGTYVEELHYSKLVVTNETEASCITETGDFQRHVRISYPIFRHWPKDCLLKVGSAWIGNRTVSDDLIPKHFAPSFIPNEGKSKSGSFFPDINIDISFGGFVNLLLNHGWILLAIAVGGVLLYRHCSRKGTQKEAKDLGVNVTINNTCNK